MVVLSSAWSHPLLRLRASHDLSYLHAQPDLGASWDQVREAACQAFKAGQHDQAEALLLQAVHEAEAPDIDPGWLIKSLEALAHLYHRLYRNDRIEATLTRLLA